jgi:hypothetical protein
VPTHKNYSHTMSANSTNPNNNNKNITCTFSANEKLTKPSAGIVIKQIPAFKLECPTVKFIRYSDEDGTWTYNHCIDNGKITEVIKMAELLAIKQVAQVVRGERKEHAEGMALTGLEIKKLRDGLQVPAGARPPRFDNDTRMWSFQANNQAALDQLMKNFEEFEAMCLAIFDPPVKYTIHVKNPKVPKQGLLFTKRVNINLKVIQLPPGSKRINFNPKTLEWEFACQTDADMDLLLDRFHQYIMQVSSDMDHPDQAEKRRAEARKIPQVVPTAIDFPSLSPLTNGIA